MKHYVYQITDPNTGEFYFGSRSYDDPVNDDYMGSYITWNPEDENRLVKEIIKDDFDTREDAIKYEAKLIEESITDKLNRNYYIPNKGFHRYGIPSWNSGISMSEEFKQKCRERMVGDNNPMKDPEIAKKISDLKIGISWGYHSEETKQKIRLSKLGDKNPMKDPEVAKKVSLAQKGRKLDPFTEQHKKRISEGLQNYTKTKEHCKNISKAKKGVPQPESFVRKRGTTVIQMDLDGNIVKTHLSLRRAAKYINGYRSYISEVCKGDREQYKGFIWKYKKNVK